MVTRHALERLTPYVAGRSLPGGIKLSSNENPRGPAESVIQAITRAAAEVNRYPDSGMWHLREAIAAFWNVSPEMVICGNGSDEILQLLGATFVDPGTTTVTAAHTFSEYAFATLLFDGDVVCAPMDDLRFDVDALADAVTDTTRMVFLCNPNNPTGTIVTAAEIERLLARLSKNVVLVIDEAYGEYAALGQSHARRGAAGFAFGDSIPFVQRHPNVIRLRTFSKIYGLAGLRVGYGIAHEALIKRLYQVRQPFNLGSIAQAAAVTALSDQAYVTESATAAVDGRDRLCDLLDELGLRYLPSWANFVCAELGPDALQIIGELESDGIAIRSLTSFDLPTYARISIGLPHEMAALETSLRRVTDARS